MFSLPGWRRLGSLVVTAAAAALLATAQPSPVSAQTGGYGDVPEGAFYATPVADLAAASLFGGTECQAGFCPGKPIDRKTMAVWMVRVLDGADPPAVSQTRFNDVDVGGFYAPFIERMAELGVTQGCGDGSGFCPDRTVTRAEMAAFVSRAYDLPDGTDPGFTDVPPNAWYGADAARLAASKISVGCGDGTKFCPEQDTTRAQMATFLWRAENPDWQPDIDEESSPDDEESPPDDEQSSPDDEQSPPDGEQSSPEGEESSPDEQTFLLSSNPDGDTFTFLGTRSSGPSTVQTRGEFAVPVFLCGPTDHFTAQYMTALVVGLNEDIASVFNRQSSGLVNVRFETGSVISPDVPWHTVHNLFDDAESNPCMEGARAISGARHILVVAYDAAALSCDGIASHGFSFLRVNPNVTPQRTLGAMYWPALYGTASMVLGIQPLEPYGRASMFAFAIEEPNELIDLQGAVTWPEPEGTSIIMSCYQRRQLGWPVSNNRPPCYGLTPAGSAVSVVPSERSLGVAWTAPTLSDGVPVTGYALRLYEHEPTAFSRFSFDPLSQQTLVAQYQASSSERSHTFEQLDPSSSYTIELDLQNRYGRTVVGSEVFRVMASAGTVRVSDLGPSGFTLSWNPVQGASRHISGFGETYFIESQFTGYGSSKIYHRGDWSGPPLSYGVTDENGNAYWTTDPSRHLQGDLLPYAFGGVVRTDLRLRSSGARFSDDQPYWDEVSNWYVRSDPNGTSFTSDQGILPDTTYTVRIIACRDDGDLIWPHSCHNFANVTVTTPSVSPSDPLRPPDNVQVIAGNTWVDVSLETVPGVGQYEICRGQHCITVYETSPWPWEVMHTLSSPRFTDLESSTTYEYTIKSCGYSVGSNERVCGPARSFSVTTTATAPGVAPNRPGSVTARAGDRWAKLEWDEVPNAGEYEITGESGRGDIARWIVRDVESRRQVRLHSLRPATDYTIEVKACRTVGLTRACSDPRAVTFTTVPEPDSQPSPPDPVSGFSVVEVTDERMCHEVFEYSWGQFLEYCGFWAVAEWDLDPGAEEYRLTINGAHIGRANWSAGGNSQTTRGRFLLRGAYTHMIGVSVCKIVGASFVCSADATLSVTPIDIGN